MDPASKTEVRYPTLRKGAPDMNPASPRTVLLATDSGHSIIGEIVDGKTNAIAYSAYGEQSAQQDVETRLGFNGQLREGNIGWYLLGNGYRAYNPRLMRFHSPDSWSPFGRGGLNAYMYCVGDPVNRSDPTGHDGLWALLKKFAGAFQLPNQRSGPLSKIDIHKAADAMRTMQRGREYGSSSDLKALVGASDYIINPKPKINWGNDGGELHGSSFSSHPERRNNPAVSWIVSGTSQGSDSSRVNSHANSLTGRATKSGPPPTYDQAMSKKYLWNSDAFAASQQGRTYVVATEAQPPPNHWPQPPADPVFNPPVNPFDDPELDNLRGDLAAVQAGVRRG